jgi:uncharacterized metal-binding protein YceD (DUF177 family)
MRKHAYQDPDAAARPWHYPVAIADVPDAGRHVDLSADAATRAAVAGWAGVGAVLSLDASFDIARHSADGLRVVGRVSAQIVQSCVVTLDPVENKVVEDVDLVFLPATRQSAQAGEAVAETTDNSPEVLVDGAVDLGAIAIEFLILGIDPYPRKPDAVFSSPVSRENAAAGPFAALAALKKRQNRPEN